MIKFLYRNRITKITINAYLIGTVFSHLENLLKERLYLEEQAGKLTKSSFLVYFLILDTVSDELEVEVLELVWNLAGWFGVWLIFKLFGFRLSFCKLIWKLVDVPKVDLEPGWRSVVNLEIFGWCLGNLEFGCRLLQLLISKLVDLEALVDLKRSWGFGWSKNWLMYRLIWKL